MILEKLQKLHRRPVKEALSSIHSAILRRLHKKHIRINHILFPSYKQYHFNNHKLCNYFSPPSIDSLMSNKDLILDVAILYCNHYFDLLGSGWVNVKHGMDVSGFEGHKYNFETPVYNFNKDKFIKKIVNKANYSTSKKIFNLISGNYIPIDWHIDFKSGFRWDQKQWYTNIKYGHLPGIDVKVPWELSRMQHLPFFAYAYAYAITKDSNNAERYLLEFKNQILDFIAQNPPNFGVNWKCAMDVGIRVSNWLLTYDLFTGLGVKFEDTFSEILINSVYDHGKFIINNLEWGQIRNNHYLANIAGLLFTSAYLAPSNETDTWLAFALQELVNEMSFQFHEDGSNFEASTNYHRLSLEIMTYSSILGVLVKDKRKESLLNYNFKIHKKVPSLLALNKQQFNLDNMFLFPNSYWERLYKAAYFSKTIVKSDGLVAQIGDNDSGRFFKLWPVYENVEYQSLKNKYLNLKEYDGIKNRTHYWNEIFLVHSHIIDVIGYIFSGKLNESPELSVIQNSFSTLVRLNFSSNSVKPKENERLDVWIDKVNSEFGTPIVYKFEISNTSAKLILAHSFPDFGLYILKNENFFLSFKCGPIGTKGLGGHDHNDQLSLILSVGNKNILVDPGTYVYTSSTEKRNFFRSTFQHFTIFQDKKEQNDLSSSMEGLFALKDRTQSKCLYFNKDGFVGYHIGFGDKVIRIGQIIDDQLIIYDYGKNIQQKKESNILFSDAYGRIFLIN
jgi:hypothetical protein